MNDPSCQTLPFLFMSEEQLCEIKHQMLAVGGSPAAADDLWPLLVVAFVYAPPPNVWKHLVVVTSGVRVGL